MMRSILQAFVILCVLSGTAMAGVVEHPSGCPRTNFCGCGVSEKVYGHPVRELYTARSWLAFPRAMVAAGMVAVYGTRHVAYIIQPHGNGTALVYDPNSGGHQTRIHDRSLRGAIIVDPHGGRISISTHRYK
jgi:hypothetical protein